MHGGALSHNKEEPDHSMFRNMDESGDHYVKWISQSKNEKGDIFTLVQTVGGK